MLELTSLLENGLRNASLSLIFFQFNDDFRNEIFKRSQGKLNSLNIKFYYGQNFLEIPSNLWKTVCAVKYSTVIGWIWLVCLWQTEYSSSYLNSKLLNFWCFDSGFGAQSENSKPDLGTLKFYLHLNPVIQLFQWDTFPLRNMLLALQRKSWQ